MAEGGKVLENVGMLLAPQATTGIMGLPAMRAENAIKVDSLNAYQDLLHQLMGGGSQGGSVAASTAPPSPPDALGVSGGAAVASPSQIPTPPSQASAGAATGGTQSPLLAMLGKTPGALAALRAGGPGALNALIPQILTPEMVNIIGPNGQPSGQVPKWQLAHLPPGYSQAAPVREADDRELSTKTVDLVGADGMKRTFGYNPKTQAYDIPMGGGGTPSIPLGDIGTNEYLRNHPSITSAAIATPTQIPRPPIPTDGASAASNLPSNLPAVPSFTGSTNGGAQSNPFAAAIEKSTMLPGQQKLMEGGAQDVLDFNKEVNEQGKEADATLPDIQQLKAARRIFQATGTLGEYTNYITGAAQNLGLGDLVKQMNGTDPIKSKAAAGQIIEKVTTAAGFANKPEAIQRLTQQEVQNLSKIFPGAITQSDDAANVMMGLREIQLKEKQAMRDAAVKMIDPKTGAPPTNLRAKLLPFTLANNKEQKDTIDRLMGNTFGPKSQEQAPSKLPAGWTFTQKKDANGNPTAIDANGVEHYWKP